MEENVPLPRINKIPFIVFDAFLVITALAVAFSAEGPLTPMRFFWVIFCVAAGGVVACMPYYVEFRSLAKLKEYDLSQANLENARRIEAAMLGIREIGETVIQQTDRSSEIAQAFETLLERMEARIGEIRSGDPAPAGIDPEQLEAALRAQFESARDEFAQAITEQTALATDKQHDKLNAALAKLQGLPLQVTLLSELAPRFESLASMITETAAQLVHATPEPPARVEAAPAVHVDTEEDDTVGAGGEAGSIVGDVDPEVAATEDEIEAAEDEMGAGGDLSAEDVGDSMVAVEDDEPEADYPGGDLDLADAKELAVGEIIEDEAESETETSGEDFSELDARYEAEMADEAAVGLGRLDLESEPPAVESEMVLEPEGAAEEGMVAEPDEETLDDLEDDFDIALASDAEDDAVPEPDAAAEDEPTDVEEAAEDVSGMGIEDWDDFGEIAASAEVDEEEPEAEPVAEEAEPPEETVDEPALLDLPPAPKKSRRKQAKGATTLIAQVLIGIGNKPFVRGTGPGLSEDKGVPMEFLEIGKWQWVAPDSDEPVVARIYKNDEVPMDDAPIEIPPGQRRSVAPRFTA